MPQPSLDARIAALATNRTAGSLALAREALDILGSAAEAAGPGWRDSVVEVAQALRSAKPGMAVLARAVSGLLGRLEETGEDAPKQAVGLATTLGDLLVERSLAAAKIMGDLLPRNGVVATCSRSSSVVRACAFANRKTKAVRVVTLYSNGHGNRLADDLALVGVACDILPDASAKDAVGWADTVLLGADAVSVEGVLNGTPSAALAMAAQGMLPVRVVCQTDKFADGLSPTPGYDLVPMAHVDELITEEGCLSRADALARLA